MILCQTSGVTSKALSLAPETCATLGLCERTSGEQHLVLQECVTIILLCSRVCLVP